MTVSWGAVREMVESLVRCVRLAVMLRLQGLWLEQCGFNIGDPILVKCEDGKLTITLDEERAFVEEHKKAFLECEMQKLEKKYEAEKKKLYRQMVAEREVRYAE